MSEEVYKHIRDFPGYMVSNFGNVMSFRIDGPGSSLRKVGKLLKPYYQIRNGKSLYGMVCLYGSGKSRRETLHRLVATAFIPNPEKKDTVNHLDGNKSNNHVDNLEWCTRVENQCHAVSTKLQGGVIINFKIAEQIRKEYIAGEVSQRALAKKYEICATQIYNIIHNQAWKKENYCT